MPPLPRAPRRAATDLDPLTRRTILARGARFEFTPRRILDAYREAEFYPDTATLMEEVAERYGLNPADVLLQVWERFGGKGPPIELDPLRESRENRANVWGYLDARHPDWLLDVLPDIEFLTSLEAMLVWARDHGGSIDDAQGPRPWLQYVNGLLRTLGLPYSADLDTRTFEWIGDAFTRTHITEPALSALIDPRLIGARAEFAEALHKRRLAGPKDLEDAVDEAAKAVESVLKVRHHEHHVTLPKQQQATSLFNTLAAAGVLPGFADKLAAAAAGPRNHMASHGQGTTIRAVPIEVADATIAAAGTAITLLASYLP